MNNNKIGSIFTPLDSVNDETVIVTQVYVENGQSVQEGDLLAEIETSKALVEITSKFNGFAQVMCSVGEEIDIGACMFKIFENENIPNTTREEETVFEEDKRVKNQKPKEVDAASNQGYSGDTKFSKDALSYINNNNIDGEQFKEYQFVTSKLIAQLLNPEQERQNIKDSRIVPATPVADAEKESINKIGKQKLNEIRYLSSVNETGLVSRLTMPIKADLKRIVSSQNFITKTPLPLIIHEISRLLHKYPKLNSYFFNDKLHNYNDIIIGVAFDNGEDGLKVASLANCDEKNLLEIEEGIAELSLKYNENKLSLQEISSATFTITDLFSSGISTFHPLINFKNSAVLGICGINNNAFNIELSFDHRITSGLEVSNFLNDLKTRLENRLGSSKKNITDVVDDSIECKKCFRPVDDDLDGNLHFLKVTNSEFTGYICSNCYNGL